MTFIKVYDIMNGRDFPTAGDVLYTILSRKMDTDEKINLDLEGVNFVPSMFLNTSIGRIIKERGTDFIKSKITFSNIQVSDAKRIQEYLKTIALRTAIDEGLESGIAEEDFDSEAYLKQLKAERR